MIFEKHRKIIGHERSKALVAIQTTRKQIGWFARELCYAYAPCNLSYYGFKTIYESDIDSSLPNRPCNPEEVAAAIRLADHYSANCRPIR